MTPTDTILPTDRRLAERGFTLSRRGDGWYYQAHQGLPEWLSPTLVGPYPSQQATEDALRLVLGLEDA